MGYQRDRRDEKTEISMQDDRLTERERNTGRDRILGHRANEIHPQEFLEQFKAQNAVRFSFVVSGSCPLYRCKRGTTSTTWRGARGTIQDFKGFDKTNGVVGDFVGYSGF